MPKLVLANTATAAFRRVFFDLRQSDGLTAATAEAAGQPQISTDGGAWTNTGIGTLSSIGNGRYYADLTQATVATAGLMIETRYKSANTIECPGDSVHVVAFNPHDSVRIGITSLPNAAAQTSGGLPTVGTGANQLSLDGSGNAAADVREWVGSTPSALVSGRVDTTVGVMQASVLTATAIATDAITAGKIAADAITASKIADGAIDAATFAASAITSTVLANDCITDAKVASDVTIASVTGAVGSVTGAVGSVTGAVGSVTGNVDGNVSGNVTGSVGSVVAGVAIDVGGIAATSFAAGAIDSAAIASNAIGAAEFATDAVNEIRDAILPKSNTAFSDIEFLMVDSADHVTPKTALTISGTRSLNGGAFGAVTGTIAEVANGIYQLDASAADMNAKVVTFRFTAAGADDTFLTIVTGG